ncbi:hypothetical protein CBOM_07687 [Ceraceosorus bombacis]|uniref:Uncharacterized protein n=1 Tax=Ceraceosorus bombacis TaxID=401625 RepID=A0A0P1BL08_9BASI|nr:hypothetical protein CBOM_07687 [Ceraceosorus bombacis]
MALHPEIGGADALLRGQSSRFARHRVDGLSKQSSGGWRWRGLYGGPLERQRLAHRFIAGAEQ